MLRLFYDPVCGLSWQVFLVHLKEMCIQLFFSGVVLFDTSLVFCVLIFCLLVLLLKEETESLQLWLWIFLPAIVFISSCILMFFWFWFFCVCIHVKDDMSSQYIHLITM